MGRPVGHRQSATLLDVDDDWRDQGHCKGLDPELFFPNQWDTLTMAEAKSVCVGCPVRSECLEFGLSQEFGIWGGTSERERKRIRRTRRLVASLQ